MNNLLKKTLAMTSAVAKATADVAKNVSESSKAYLELSEKKAKLEEAFKELGRIEFYMLGSLDKEAKKAEIQFLLDDIAALEAELNTPAKKAEEEPVNSEPIKGEIVNDDLSQTKDAEVE
jgi:hypothetical protein